MPLYELIGIVRAGKVQEVKDIARTISLQCLKDGGVIRGITNWGVFLLPRPLSKYTVKHHVGHHFIVRFDANAAARREMMKLLQVDPRVLRAGCVKLGTKLGEIKDVPGQVEWGVPFKANRDEVPEWRKEKPPQREAFPSQPTNFWANLSLERER